MGPGPPARADIMSSMIIIKGIGLGLGTFFLHGSSFRQSGWISSVCTRPVMGSMLGQGLNTC